MLVVAGTRRVGVVNSGAVGTDRRFGLSLWLFGGMRRGTVRLAGSRRAFEGCHRDK